jgi:HAD superfamily hydrolase (TIGR01509 family)
MLNKKNMAKNSTIGVANFSNRNICRWSQPFSCGPELLSRVHEKGMKVAVASSAKKDELETYLEIARITKLVDVATSSEDVTQSKPAPDIFQVALEKLGIDAHDAVVIGDTPYDAEAAGKAGVATIGFLSGGF